MKRAYCYYRKSIELAAEKSIERQRDIVTEYAAENGIEIVKEYSEVASSTSIDREELQNMFKDLSNEKNIDYILVFSFDRITREVDDLGWILTQLKKVMKVKTRIHSVTEENDYEDDHIKLFMTMMRTFGSTQERINIVNRLQGSRQRKAANGGYVGGTVPMGYQAIKGTAKLHINELEVPTVHEVFQLREAGMTMQEIADKLNEKGFRTRRNKEFKPMTIQRILKNERLYKGETEAPRIL